MYIYIHMVYLINYGTMTSNIDVTNFCLNFLQKDNYIFIPQKDVIRAKMFGDPEFGTLKSIIINDGTNLLIFDHDTYIIIDLNKSQIYSSKSGIEKDILDLFNNFTFPIKKLTDLQNELIIKHGNFEEEYSEQLMSALFLTGKEKVLEIGSNVGRNSLIIGNILRKNNNNDFVSIECDPIAFKKLKENRDINNLHFHIENCALSKRKLIQRGWDTIVSEDVKEGWTPVKTITYNELKQKYNIKFDTLVADCEGALLYILLDMPELLENINLVIMENDYKTAQDKSFIDYIFGLNRLKPVYSKPLDSNLLSLGLPCTNNFYEVWKKE